MGGAGGRGGVGSAKWGIEEGARAGLGRKVEIMCYDLKWVIVLGKPVL